MLHAPHAAELGKLGVDAATSQKLLDKGISGPAMIEVAQHGQIALARTGKLRNPHQLAGFLDEIQAKVIVITPGDL